MTAEEKLQHRVNQIGYLQKDLANTVNHRDRQNLLASILLECKALTYAVEMVIKKENPSKYTLHKALKNQQAPIQKG